MHLFFQKGVNFFNFSFKYIEIKACYQGFDYGRWITNYVFLWYPINLWTSIETIEIIKHLDDFFGHFSDWREKRSKWRFHSLYIDGRASFALKVQHNLYAQKLHFEHFFAPDEKFVGWLWPILQMGAMVLWSCLGESKSTQWWFVLRYTFESQNSNSSWFSHKQKVWKMTILILCFSLSHFDFQFRWVRLTVFL